MWRRSPDGDSLIMLMRDARYIGKQDAGDAAARKEEVGKTREEVHG